MQKSLVLLSLVCAGAVLGAQQLVPMPVEPQARVPIGVKSVKGAPYSAQVETESMQSLADGNRIVRRTGGRVYRDGEGRTRREEDRASGGPSISIVDASAGVSYSLDSENHIAWKTNAPSVVVFNKLQAELDNLAATLQPAGGGGGGRGRGAAPGAGQPTGADLEKATVEARQKIEAAAADRKGDPTAADRQKVEIAAAAGVMLPRSGGRGGVPGNSVEERLPARTIEGVLAEGTRRTTTIPAGAIGNELPITVVSEEWTSSELQVLVLTQHSDPRIGTSTYRLLNIIRGEPDHTLFQVPSDYTIRETGIRRMERSPER